MGDDEYADFQKFLADNPEAGDLIQGTGGLRKVRVKGNGKGKRGGVRMIYYHFVSADRIAMLFAYPKSEKADLSMKERKALKSLISNWTQP